MSLLYAALAVAFFLGSALLLGGVRPLRRTGLADRVRPYVAPTTSGGVPVPSGTAVGAVVAPLADFLGARIARLTGIRTALEVRLLRAGRSTTPSQFRVSQLVHALLALGGTTVLLLLLSPPLPIAVVALPAAPVLASLLDERALDSAIAARATSMSLELPIVAEQLGILLGAGLSLGAALQRIASRGDGLVAGDLQAVVREVRRGRSEIEALREWSELADSKGVDRLVSVLALHRDAVDLGSLISTEATAIREQTHRELVEAIEKRGQLVWVPVTVATLVPGLILIGVPFVRAMSAVAR